MVTVLRRVVEVRSLIVSQTYHSSLQRRYWLAAVELVMREVARTCQSCQRMRPCWIAVVAAVEVVAAVALQASMRRAIE